MGKMFEELPAKDVLKSWISAYASYEEVTRSNEASLEYLMRFWETSKKTLFQLMGGKFILEKEIEYVAPPRELKNKISVSLLTGEMRDFRVEFEHFVAKLDSENDKLRENCVIDEIYDEWATNNRNICYLYEFMNPEHLASNVFSPRNSKPAKFNINGHCITLQRGMTISRILGKFASAANLEGYEKFRIAHSQFLNQKKIRGTMCLSIHPLDYFSMSDNDNNWESCMSWRNRGCYRMGTVEMCNSPYVLVAYLKSAKDMRHFSYTWNNKKWRNLVIFTNDFITTIKDYPYRNDEFNEFVVDWIKELAEKNLGWTYEKHNHFHKFDSNYEELTVGNKSLSFNFETNFMYNDFNNDAPSTFCLRSDIEDDYNININYSGSAECMHCGDALSTCEGEDVDDAGCVICNKCSSYYSCSECGERVHENEVYWLDDEPYCEYCYDNHCIVDAITKNSHADFNCTRVYLLTEEQEEELPNITDYFEFSSLFSEYIYVYEIYDSSFEKYFGPYKIARFPRGYLSPESVYFITKESISPDTFDDIRHNIYSD